MAKKTTKKKPAKKRRSTRGPGLEASAGALDVYLDPGGRASKASRRGLAPAGTTPRPKKAERKSPPKVRATFHLPVDLLDELRDAAVALAGPPERVTLAGVAETALRKELERLKRKHTKGKTFPRRSGELKGGRPIGS